MSQELIRISEATQITGLNHQTIRNYVKAGRLTGYKVGNLHKVDRKEVLGLFSVSTEGQPA